MTEPCNHKILKIFENVEDDDYHYMEGGDDDPNDPKNKYKKDVDGFSTGLTDEGIPRNRCCTDILCLVVYFAFIGAMIYATAFGYKNGNVKMLTAPIDADFSLCGFNDTVGFDKMVLSHYEVTKVYDILKSGICVKECPTATTVWEEGVNIKCPKAYKGTANCNGFFTRKTYETYDAFDFCLPKSTNALNEKEKLGLKAVKKQFSESPAGSLFQDMWYSSTAMYISFGLALLWSLIFIYILSRFAEPLAWCCVVLIQIGLLCATIGTAYMWNNATEVLNKQKADSGYNALTPEQQKAWDKQNGGGPTTYLIGMIVFGILTFVWCCMVFMGRESLKRAIDVIDASADYVAGNKRVILVPNIHFVLTLIFVVVWIGAMMCVASLNEIKADTLVPQMKNLTWKKDITYLGLFMLFGFFWVTAWIDYTSNFIVIMGAVTYYFNNRYDNKEEQGADICYGVKAAYFHHIGSIALGAFLIALIRFIKFVFYYLAKKMEKAGGDNAAVKCAVKCAMCVLNCIEKIVDYLNENAFCYMAVTGDYFLKAAWNGFLLNLKHGLKFVFANTIAKVFIFIGKIGIVVGNCFSCYFIMKARGDLEEVGSMWGPILVVAFVTYLCASLFLGLFSVAVQSLLVSLCVDLDMNGGRPKFGPPTFHDREATFKGDDEKEGGNKVNSIE